ncbi:MAG: methionine--tRNA ligase [Pseudomonadota bacterium]|nr:methionine--tRNA ligase [Pseudomonadota bacterium]
MGDRKAGSGGQVARFYVTTPIYYVNDVPHVGHAYTTVAADTVARWRRLRGDDVMFLTGTDEHGQKVLRAAEKKGHTPQEHADETHVRFKQLWDALGIQFDHFIRTTDASHQAFVQAQLQKLYDNGELYASDYSGWYSTSAERFWAEDELKDGKCPDTGQPVEWITEKNWFFKMSAYQDRLLAHIAAHPDCIQPELRRNEVLGYLKKPLGDLCISRPKARLPWGIPLPFDRDYVTYVWFDALSNYLSALEGGKEAFWPADYHIIGKDILTFHTVYWFSMLFAMGYAPPKHVYAHGWWTVEGTKMSKSLGNVVDPHLLVDAYGADAVRYFLLREIPFGGDGDFSHQAFLVRYNADLANDLGNLGHRVLATMLARWMGGVVPEAGPATDNDRALAAVAVRAAEAFDTNVSALQFRQALEALWELVRAGNKYIDTEEPWALNKRGETARLGTVLRNILEIWRIAASHLACLWPKKSGEMLAKLGLTEPDLAPTFDRLVPGTPVSAGDPLFPRLDAIPAGIQAALVTAKAAIAAETPEPKNNRKAAKADKPKTPELPVSTDAPVTTPATTPPAAAPAPTPALIEYDDFGKVQLRTGRIVSAARHPNADKLLVLQVDVGEPEARQIVAGIAAAHTPESLVGKDIVVVVNMKPAKLRGLVSQGMLLAAGGGDVAALLTAGADIAPGTVVK